MYLANTFVLFKMVLLSIGKSNPQSLRLTYPSKEHASDAWSLTYPSKSMHQMHAWQQVGQ